MKANEIQVGKRYAVKVSGKVVPCKVIAKREDFPRNRPNGRDIWDCINTVTGRKITVRSPQKFRFSVDEMEKAGVKAFTTEPTPEKPNNYVTPEDEKEIRRIIDQAISGL